MPPLARLVAVLVGGTFIASIAYRDTVAAAMAIGGVGVAWWVVRHRSKTVTRSAVLVLVAGMTLVAAVAALVLPTYRGRPAPLIVPKARGANVAAAPPLPVAPAAGTDHFMAVGFVASDYDDSASGLDRDASMLSTVAATGIVLSKSPGSIEVATAADSLMRAHLAGATGLAVVSNFDGSQFNGKRAAAMIQSRSARRRFISALIGEVARRGWDGVVLDFEQLPAQVRGNYVKLVHGVSAALGARELTVAVPALAPDDPDLGAYDLDGLGRAADHIVWMAYDEHELGDPPGPVAGMPWVQQTLHFAMAHVPAPKLLLGVATYGYAWRGPGDAEEQTVADARALASQPGASATWDPIEQEWRCRTADGRTLWYEDSRGFAARAALAHQLGLAGVALWRVGADEPGTLAALPEAPLKHYGLPVDRSVQQVPAAGVAALTFDDGPDPKWTPRILHVLAREHVPATFFLIGTEAQQHQALVRKEVREGDVVGNHTYSHKNLSKLPNWRAKAEILGGAAVVEGITGLRPTLFRSPYGAGDMSGRTIGSDQIAANLGDHPVNWNDDAEDWRGLPASVIVNRVVSGASERTIILLHDGGGDRRNTLIALPEIIRQLRNQGYVFTTVDALDASVASPYASRTGVASSLRGVAVVAGFRLDMAARRMVLWLVILVAALSILRLLTAGVLGGWHAYRHKRHRTPTPVELPTVSVVIPAHNEARVIGKTLRSLLAASGVHEIIVVDDGSDDATEAVARRYPCTVMSQPQSGKAIALNNGVAAATGDVIVVIDADTIVSPELIETMAVHFVDGGVGAVAGNVKVGNRRRLLARLQALEYIVSLNLDRRAQAVLNVVAVVPGAAGAFRRSALLSSGGFVDDTLVEDADLTVMLLLAGWRIVYEPAAVAWTEAPESTNDVIRQRRRWSYGTVEVAAKHAPTMLNGRHGRVGVIGLPWMVLSQVLLPLLGPVSDLFLLYLLVTGSSRLVLLLLAIGAALDLVVCAWAIALDHEDPRLLLWAPLLRYVWRPLQLLSVARSVRRWIRGQDDTWRRVHRYGTVPLSVAGRRAPEPTL